MVKRMLGLLRGRLGWILRIAVTVGLFVLLFRLVNMDEMVQYLRQVIVGWLVVAAVVKMVGILAAIVRWDMLLRAQGIRVPFTHLVGSFMVGRFIGMFLPSTIGLDTYRAYDIAQHAKDAIGSVAVILVEKVTGFFTLSLLILLALPAGLNIVPVQILIIVGLAFCLPVALAFVLLLRPGVFERLLRWNFPGKARIEGKLRQAVAAITAYRDHQGYLWIAVALGLVVHGATALMYLFTAKAVQVSVSTGYMLFVGPLIIVATLVGPVVAGLGAREYTAIYLLELIGVDRAAGALVGHLGFWTAEALPAVLGGLVLALRPASYRPAIEHARRPAPAPAVQTQPHTPDLAPPPLFWRHALLPGLASGAIAGLLAGLGEALALAINTRSVRDLTALPYAAILYALIGLVAGAFVASLLFFAARGLRPKNPAHAISRWSFGLVFVGMAGLVARFRIIRDVFHEHLRTFSPVGLLVHFGLFLAALALLIAVLFVARRLQRTRSGSFLSHGGSFILVLVLVGVAFLAAAMAGPGRPSSSRGTIPQALRSRPNIVLIGVDTLRADHLSCYGYGEPTSPNIDALAADGVLYENMVGQSSWTKPSFATIMTSLYPSSHTAVYKSSRLPQGVLTLAEVLQTAGYATGGFADNINIAPSFGFDQGFDDYTFLEPTYPLGATAASSQLAFYQALRRVYYSFAGDRVVVQHFYQDAQTVTEEGLQWLGEHQSERFFLFLHYMDPHDPYMEHELAGDEYRYSGLGFPRARDQNPDPDLAPTFVRLYDQDIAFLDHHLGRLFGWLKDQGLYENTIIILTADHGEEFYEHGGWWHGTTLFGEQISVPLIIKFPESARAGTVELDFARSLDISPTILDVAELPVPEGWQGRTLWSDSEPPEWVFAEEDHEGNQVVAVIQGSYKFIQANEDNPRGLLPEAFYDLSSDPGEFDNLWETRAELARSLGLVDLLNRAQAEARSKRVEAESGALDPAIEEQLRNLGY